MRAFFIIKLKYGMMFVTIFTCYLSIETMKRPNKKLILYSNCILIEFIILSFVIISCTTKEIQYPRTEPYTHSNSEYDDKFIINASIDIFYPAYTFTPYADSITNVEMQKFNSEFGIYFPFGVKMFSTFKEIKVKEYENPDNPELIYNLIEKPNGEIFSIITHDSISNFLKICKSDFLFIVHTFSIAKYSKGQYKSEATNLDGYVTRLNMNYSIWDNLKNSFVCYNDVEAVSEFYNLGEEWSFKGVISKLAFETFNELPMFSD
jgi:hypothetical protein